MSMSNITEIAILRILIAVDGTAKNIRAIRMLPIVRVVYETSKNPDPLECIFGGLTKIDTKSRNHHAQVITRKRTSNHRKARTLHKLYGDT